MMKTLLPFFLAAILVGASSSVPASDVAASVYTWPEGDPRHCQVKSSQSKMDIGRFEVLPGIGWDNLQNVEAGQIIHFNYTKCRTTDDGAYLVPDNVFTVPIKTSDVQTFAELIAHWTNSTSTDSSTVNVHAGLSLGKFGISGSFSREHQLLKSKQILDKAVTTRVQIRYDRYESKLQPDAKFTHEFRNRLLRVAGHILLNETESAFYEAQLIVRDFGTHVLTSVTAGAGLIKEDYLKEAIMTDKTTDTTKIMASASVSFASIFSAGASASYQTDKTTSDLYNHSLTHSYTRTHGGGLFVPGVTTAEVWAEGVKTNLVPMDRAGDPIYFLITPHYLPELPPLLVDEVEKIVQLSVELYYKMNLIPGCTQRNSPEFSMAANFDDGSCTQRPTNKTFGGLYQTCVVSGSTLNVNPCKDLDQVNPQTGKHSCPEHYTAVLLHSGYTPYSHESKHSCHRCWVFAHCCHTDQYSARGSYSTYWCAATGSVPEDSGYLFGGIYTKTQSNPVTGEKKCPEQYYPRSLSDDAFVCISDDFQAGAELSIPFGGFFSCSSGNPLASKGVTPVGSLGTAAQTHPSSLKQFLAAQGEVDDREDWPKRCPEGYNQHLATDETGCAIHYCTDTAAFGKNSMPPIKRPPFIERPEPLLLQPVNLIMNNMTSYTWVRNQEEVLMFDSERQVVTTAKPGAAPRALSSGLTLVLGVFATVAFF